MMRVLTLILFFSLAVFSSGAQQRSNTKSKAVTLFSVDKKPFLAEEFIYLYRKNHPEKPGEYTKEKVEEYLDLFINFKLKVQEAKYRGLDTTQAFRKEYATYREELRKPYLPDAKLTDSLVRLTYNRMKEEVRASHLLINLKPDASPEDTLKAYEKIIGLRNRVVQGENFADIASTYSEDPSAWTNKGDLGYFTAMQMVFPFEQAVYATPVGNISMPVRTRFGYHLIKVTDRRPSRGEVEVSHIMLRTGEGFDNDKAKNTIFEIFDKLRKGVKWEELCKEYSEDPSSKDNGGRLRPFGVGAMSGVPEFEQMAFNLQKPGDFSDPFQTRFGWHIIRLESKIPLPSFEELSPTLKNKVNRDERSQISKQRLHEKMKKDFGFTEKAEVKANVLALADTTLTKGKWKAPGSIDGSLILFSLKDKNFPVKDFFIFAEKNQRPNSLSPEKYLLQLYDQYVEERLGLLLEEKIKAQHPDYRWLLKEYYEGILLFEIMEKEVWNKASEDSIGQRNYFESNAMAYQAKERVRAKLFSSPSRALLDELKTLIEAKDSSKIQAFVSGEKIRQEAGAFEKTERSVLGKVPWSPGLFLSENNDQHYLVWITEMVAPGPRTFDEARPAVISDYQRYLEEQWISQLKKKFPVKVNKKGKQYILKQLVKS